MCEFWWVLHLQPQQNYFNRLNSQSLMAISETWLNEVRPGVFRKELGSYIARKREGQDRDAVLFQSPKQSE